MMGYTKDLLTGLRSARGGLSGLAGLRGLSGGAAPPSVEEIKAVDPGEGYLTSALLAPVRAAGGLLEGIGYVDATTRAALGGLLGVKGSGQETLLGSAPSGRELLGLGPGKQGTVESGDIPGFAVEALASPLNLLGVGSLSKAGKAAKALEEASLSAKAYAAAGEAAKAAELAPRIAGLTNELTQARAPLAYGKSLAEQGAQGQRSLLSLNVPGLEPISLLPRSVNAAGLGAIGGGYERLIGAPLRPAYDALFKPAGEMTGEPLYNRLVQQTAREGGREGAYLGREEAAKIAETLSKLPVSATDVDTVRTALDNQLARLKADYLNKFGKPMPDKILRKLDLSAGLVGEQPAHELTLLGLEHTGVDAKVGAAVGEIQTELQRRTAHYNQQILARQIAGQPLGWLPARKAQAAKVAARKMFPLLGKLDLSATLLQTLPQDVAAEVGRIAAVTGQTLSREQAAGVRVAELTDPLLGYVFHSVSPAGRELADNLLKLGVQDDDALRVVRQFTTQPDFTKRRTEALRGLGILQANDWMGTQAASKAAAVLADPNANRAQRAAATNVQRLLADGATFFTEDPATAVLKRLTSGGEASGNARLMAGAANLFSVPKNAAGPNALPIAQFLERAGIGQINGTPLGKSEHAIAQALKGTSLEGLYVPATYAGAALESSRMLRDPDELKGAIGLFNRISSLTRLGATIASPSYYARNGMGNAANMWLAGFRNPRHLANAWSIVRRSESNSLTAQERAAVKRWAELGSVDTGAAVEIRDLTREAGVFGDRTAIARGASGLVDRGLALNRTIENVSKVALQLDGEAKGLSRVEAAERVKKYLFDYSNLSPFEKKYLRRAAFFYTFSRFNVPLQMQALLANPRTARLYAMATGRIGDSEQKRSLPDWQANSGLIYTGRNADDNLTFLAAGLPYEDVYRYSDEGGGIAGAARKFAQQLTPLLRVPIEGLTGVSLQTGQPIEPRPAQAGIAGLLPPQLAQDAALLLQAEAAGPTSPLSGLAYRAAETGTPDKTLSGLLIGKATGLTPLTVDSAKAAQRKRREAGINARRHLTTAGVPADDERMKLINRALRK